MRSGGHLDVTLIERGHSFVGLTAEGERLLTWAKRIVTDHAALQADMRAMRSSITGTLRVGTIPTAATTSSLVLSAFCSNNPMAKVQIRSQLATSELYRLLRNFELDAAILPVVPEETHGVELELLAHRWGCAGTRFIFSAILRGSLLTCQSRHRDWSPNLWPGHVEDCWLGWTLWAVTMDRL